MNSADVCAGRGGLYSAIGDCPLGYSPHSMCAMLQVSCGAMDREGPAGGGFRTRPVWNSRRSYCIGSPCARSFQKAGSADSTCPSGIATFARFVCRCVSDSG